MKFKTLTIVAAGNKVRFKTSDSEREKKPRAPKYVWVLFDSTYFPEGVTKLQDEAEQWANEMPEGWHMKRYEYPVEVPKKTRKVARKTR